MGAGDLGEGRAAVSQPGPGPRNLSLCPWKPAGRRDLPFPPCPSRGQPSCGKLCPAEGGDIQWMEWGGRERGVITFQRNEVRAPLFPI